MTVIQISERELGRGALSCGGRRMPSRASCGVQSRGADSADAKRDPQLCSVQGVDQMWTRPSLIVTFCSGLLISGPVFAMSIEVQGNRGW